MKKYLKFIFFYLLPILLLQSCAAEFSKISSNHFEPTDPNKIELFFSKIPNRDYEEIALVRMNVRTKNCCFDEIKQAAAKLGANAVIQIRLNETVNGIAVRWK